MQFDKYLELSIANCNKYFLSLILPHRIYNSGGSRNFKTGGRGPDAVEFLGSGVCFDVPFTHTLCLLVTMENKVHIVSTV